MNDAELISHADLIATLQSALGQERADRAILEAAEELGLAGQTYRQDQALAVLGRIAEHDGLLGISARFARSRLMTRLAGEQLSRLRTAGSSS